LVFDKPFPNHVVSAIIHTAVRKFFGRRPLFSYYILYLVRYYIFKVALKLFLPTAVLSCAIFLSGCGVPQPGVRLGSYATATLGTHFLDADNLGRHHYGGSCFEKNGIVYTCKGGHVDITHARIAADNVRYLQNKAKRALLKMDRQFKFKLKVEPSTYYVTLEYPPTWKNLPKKEKSRIADEVSIELGAYCVYVMTTWHEVLTWFGFKSMAFIPEQPSAFSWEDVYSNVFGIKIGTLALRDKTNGYNKAVTIAFQKELKGLGIQPKSTARKASEKMRGTWYEGALIAEMKVRNLDVGIDDGFVTPMIVPGVCKNAFPQSLPVPKLKPYMYGFKITLEVEPREMEKDRIFKIIYPEVSPSEYPRKVQPAKHLPAIMNYIKREVAKKQMGKPLHFPNI
jgi:hypothetical protein